LSTISLGVTQTGFSDADLDLLWAALSDMFEHIQPSLNEGIAVPRDFADYTVTVNEVNMSAGVTLQRRIG
jgi:hypothetical protein